MKKIHLPRKFKFDKGYHNPLYAKYDGWNRISHSQVNSFNDETYCPEYFGVYFLEEPRSSNIFADFGSDVGDFINPDEDRPFDLLSDNDKKIITDYLAKEGINPDICTYEFEVLIDLEPFGLKQTVLQGFTDRQYESDEGLHVCDFKTLNMSKKKSYYESRDYKQLNIYGYGLEKLGYKIADTYVVGFDRKGNTVDTDSKNVLRLSGLVERIENPYKRENAEEDLKYVADTCIKISEYYKVYNKFLKDKKLTR